MATMANIFNNRFAGAAAIGETASAVRTHSCVDFKLRPVPNEDVYFFVKKIDNTRVVRASDPKSRSRDVRFLVGSCMVAGALIAMLLPSAYGLMAGYQFNALNQEHQRLVTERATLDLEEARLLSPERLQELAKMQQFIDPAPERQTYLESKNDSSLALNHR